MLAEYENVETSIACEQDPEASSWLFFCSRQFFLWTCQLKTFILHISDFFCGASLIVSQWFVDIRDAGRTVGQNCSKYSSNLTSMSHITTTTTYLQRLLSPGMMVLSCNWEMGDDG